MGEETWAVHEAKGLLNHKQEAQVPTKRLNPKRLNNMSLP